MSVGGLLPEDVVKVVGIIVIIGIHVIHADLDVEKIDDLDKKLDDIELIESLELLDSKIKDSAHIINNSD